MIEVISAREPSKENLSILKIGRQNLYNFFRALEVL